MFLTPLPQLRSSALQDGFLFVFGFLEVPLLEQRFKPDKNERAATTPPPDSFFNI